MTVAPPLSRLHLVPAVGVTALLCAALACPVAAKPKDAKAEPPGQAKKAAPGGKAKGTPPGQAKKAAPGGKAKGTPPGQAKRSTPGGKANGTPPGQAKKAAPGGKATPPGQAKKAARGGNATPPGQAKKAQAPAAPPAASAPPGRARKAAARARAARARQRAAARARAARRASAVRRARATRIARTFLPASVAPQAPPEGDSAGAGQARDRARPRADDGGRRFEPIIPRDQLPQPLRVVRDIVEVVPTPLRFLIAALAVLSLVLAAAYGLTLVRNRRLARERRELLGEVGLLQAALLPELPETLSSSRASVAYRPADGPGAGGDFYDVVPLAGGQTAVLIGDVSGHGRAALARTTLARYTLRAYAEAGMEPREVVQMAGSVMAGKLQGDFVTALVAIHDPAEGTLTYATAGHPPPIVISTTEFEPVLVGTAPPLGVGAGTGQRQTTIPFPRGAVACFYTDGLSEARTAYGRLGAQRLEEIVRRLGQDVTAEQVIARVTETTGTLADDAAVCVIAAEEGAAIVRSRVERIDVSRGELRGPMVRAFLHACGVSPRDIRVAERDAREAAAAAGGAVLEVRMGEGAQVQVFQPELAPGDARLELNPPV